MEMEFLTMEIRPGVFIGTFMGSYQKIHYLFKASSGYYAIHETMLHKELRSLETFRKLLTYGLPDYSGTCETDKCPGLSHDHVAQHCKACSHTACSRVGQYRAVEKPCLTVPLYGSRCLGHLHKRDDALLHPGAA